MKKTFFGLDGPLESSTLGSKNLALDFNSEAVSEGVQMIFDLEYDLQKKRKEIVVDQIMKSN